MTPQRLQADAWPAKGSRPARGNQARILQADPISFHHIELKRVSMSAKSGRESGMQTRAQDTGFEPKQGRVVTTAVVPQGRGQHGPR